VVIAAVGGQVLSEPAISEARDRVSAALDHIDAHRLLAAPDCGLGLLGRDLLHAKLQVLAEAAHSL
jgi:5-methyltetrahydropteroyltriglutamate--homocysteine methyltransferase